MAEISRPFTLVTLMQERVTGMDEKKRLLHPIQDNPSVHVLSLCFHSSILSSGVRQTSLPERPLERFSLPRPNTALYN